LTGAGVALSAHAIFAANRSVADGLLARTLSPKSERAARRRKRVRAAVPIEARETLGPDDQQKPSPVDALCAGRRSSSQRVSAKRS
jgi:hypothetical protein